METSKEPKELRELREQYKKAQQKHYDKKRPGIAYSLHFDVDVWNMLEDLRVTKDMDKKEIIQLAVRDLHKRTPDIRRSSRRVSEEE